MGVPIECSERLCGESREVVGVVVESPLLLLFGLLWVVEELEGLLLLVLLLLLIKVDVEAMVVEML